MPIPRGTNYTRDLWPYWNNAHHLIPKELLNRMIQKVAKGDADVRDLVRAGLPPVEYRILNTLGDADDATLAFVEDFIEGIGYKAWHVGEGERLGFLCPTDARILLRKSNPGMKLSSLLGNSREMLILSREFKDVLERTCMNEIEYLPFTLYDHRKRVLSADYFIVNPIGTLDCLDLEKSDIAWSKDTPPKILRIREHVLDRRKLHDAPQIFRIREDSGEYVVGPALADAMRAHQPKLTNVRWRKLRFNDEV